MLLHEKAARLRRKRDNIRLAVSGSVSFMLVIVLGALMFNNAGFTSVETVSRLTGSSLLGENAGGYVLVAVISFFTAVFLTVFLLRRQNGKNKSENDSTENGEEKTQ